MSTPLLCRLRFHKGQRELHGRWPEYLRCIRCGKEEEPAEFVGLI